MTECGCVGRIGPEGRRDRTGGDAQGWMAGEGFGADAQRGCGESGGGAAGARDDGVVEMDRESAADGNVDLLEQPAVWGTPWEPMNRRGLKCDDTRNRPLLGRYVNFYNPVDWALAKWQLD